jgi:RNA 3'-terminal phosphate cyclase-like protein
VNFLRLVSRITVKSTFELSADRTRLLFIPGLIAAGATVVHDLPTPDSVATAAAEAKQEPILRAAGYFIEPLLLLLPFARTKCSVTLVGPTQGPLDLSVHTLRTVSIPIAKAFGVEAQLRVVRHSSGDGGCVILTVEPVRRLRSVKLVDFGLVSRVRGIAFGSDVAADLPQRCATSAKGVLLNFLPDIAVPTDVTSNARSGHAKGSGFGIMLVAYTTANGTVVSQEATASVREAPEDVGQRAAKLLLEEISRAGCIDRHHQALTLFLMALGPDEVSSVRFGGFSPMASTVVDLLDQFFAVHPVMKDEASSMPGGPMTTLVRCLGSGTINLTKRSS